MKLHEIDHQLERLLDEAVDVESGEVRNDHLFAQLNGLHMQREHLALDLACYAKGLRAEADAIKAEREKLQKRESSVRNRFEGLKTYLGNCLPRGEKLKDARASISWRKSKGLALSAAPEELDPRFQKTKIEANVSEIRQAIEAGEEIPGAELEERHNIQLS